MTHSGAKTLPQTRFPLIPDLGNNKFAGFNVHIIGRDPPKFCLRKCVESQITKKQKGFCKAVNREIYNNYSNARQFTKVATEKIVANSAYASLNGQETAQMPDSRIKIHNFAELLRLINGLPLPHHRSRCHLPPSAKGHL